MMSFRLFEEQDAAYREECFPLPCVNVWRSKPQPACLGINMSDWTANRQHGKLWRFRPASVLFEKFGFTAENVAKQCLDLIEE